MRTRLAVLLVLSSLSAAVGRPAPDDPPAPLEGTWTITKGERDGKDQNQGDSKGEFRFDRGSVKIAAGAEEAQYRYEVRAAGKAGGLPEIDFRAGDGDGRGGMVLRGVYKLDGDDLVVCASVVPFPRPTGLATAKGSSVVMFTLRRKK